MEDFVLYPQVFYAIQGQISNPGINTPLLDNFPSELPALVKAIQGIMLHLHWAHNLIKKNQLS